MKLVIKVVFLKVMDTAVFVVVYARSYVLVCVI